MDACESIIASTLEKIRRLRLPRDDFPSVDVDRLKWMRDFLRDAEQFACAEQVNTLVADIACDAENAIDMVVLVGEKSLTLGPEWDHILVPLHNIGVKIEEIKQRIGHSYSSGQTYRFIPIIGGWPRLEERRRSAALARGENEVVCYGKDADVLVQLLRGGGASRRVVSIVAPGGAGKTTLARRIYNRCDVRTDFIAASAWIYVNDRNVGELLQDVAEQVMDMPKEDSAGLNIKHLREMLSNFLEERRYLIVLDDVRREGVWDQLAAAFPYGNNSSRIMLTTGNMGVAIHAGSSPANPPYVLPLLTPEESCKLFLKKAFPWMVGEPTHPAQLEDTGKQIVAKCEGLPLAIEVIGGLIGARGEGKENVIAAREEGKGGLLAAVGEGKEGLIAAGEEETVGLIAAGGEGKAGLVAAGRQDKGGLMATKGKAKKGFLPPRRGLVKSKILTEHFSLLVGAKGKGKELFSSVVGAKGKKKLFSPVVVAKGTEKGAPMVAKGKGKEGPVVATVEGDVVDWKHVQQSLNEQLSQECVNCLDILALSYSDLPCYLKSCLLYLGLFPKCRKIEVQKLTVLWVAEGFIQPREKQSKEEVAKDYFLELIGRSMIQVVERDWNGEAVTCCIHDLLHDLIIAEATRHDFFEINHQVSASTLNSTRRLAIHYEINTDSLINYSNPSLRSVLCFTQSMSKLPSGDHMLLRVLDLEGVQVQEDVLDFLIKEHIHLKYLNLRGTSIESLPPSISNLHSLETLLLGYCTLVPEAIWKMHRLRHLDALDCEFEGEPRLCHLKNLHTLCLSAGDWIDENSLSSLNGLRILKVTGDIGSQLEVLWRSIEKLVNLQSLMLSESSIAGDQILLPSLVHHLHLYEMVLAVSLMRLPERYEFPLNLTRLILDRSGLNEDPMPTLGKLAKLETLQLSCNVYKGKKMISSANGFPQLICLTFLCLDDLEEWIVEEGAMPKLLHLSISVCPNLDMLPEGLRYIPTLREFETLDISMKLYDRLRESQGDDWYKIQHIPHLRICQ